MIKFIVTEKQNINSYRKGELVEAKNITAAKRAASKNQFFRGTILTIESEEGILLAAKENGVWRMTVAQGDA